MAPPPMRPAAVLVGEPPATTSTPTRSRSGAPALRVRSGARVLVLPMTGVAGLAEVLRAFAPQVVVIAGAEAPDDQVARWAYRVRSATGALPMTLYRRGRVDAARTTARARRFRRRSAPPRARHARRPAREAAVRLKTKSTAG